MADRKTNVTTQPMSEYLDALQEEAVRADCWTIARMMEASTKSPGEMWGPHIIGFGRRMIPYSNRKDQEWMMIGFSPRKQNLTLYIPGGLESRGELLERLGVHSCGKGCLYIKRLSDVNLAALEELIDVAVREATR